MPLAYQHHQLIPLISNSAEIQPRQVHDCPIPVALFHDCNIDTRPKCPLLPPSQTRSSLGIPPPAPTHARGPPPELPSSAPSAASASSRSLPPFSIERTTPWGVGAGRRFP